MHFGLTFLLWLRMISMLVGIWLGLYWYYFLSSIITMHVHHTIIFKVQLRTWAG